MYNYDLILINPPYHLRNGSSVIFPIGLGYIAATALCAGFTVKIIDGACKSQSLWENSVEGFKNWLLKELSASLPKLAIGIGPCTTSSVRSIKTISEICKAVHPNIPLIYGGPLTSIPGQEPLFFEEFAASTIIPGDGEYVVQNLLRALYQNKPLETVNGIITQENKTIPCNIVEDLDATPFPFRDKINNDNNYHLSLRRDLFHPPFATMVSARGCPYKCSFCLSGILRGGQYHRRSISNITQEIKQLQSGIGAQTVVFYDDNFFPSGENLSTDIQTVSEAFSNIPKPLYWQIEMRPDILPFLEPEHAKELYKMGCRQINIGIEKGGDRGRKAIGKNVYSEKIRNTIKKIRKTVPSMRFTGTFILGGPDETMKTIEETIEFAVSLELLFAHFYPLEVYPGTSLFAQTYPNANPLWWYEQIMRDNLPWGEIIYEGNTLNREELLKCVALAYKKFYQREKWHKIARAQFGKYYKSVAKSVAVWQHDRFRLRGKK